MRELRGHLFGRPGAHGPRQPVADSPGVVALIGLPTPFPPLRATPITALAGAGVRASDDISLCASDEESLEARSEVTLDHSLGRADHLPQGLHVRMERKPGRHEQVRVDG